MTRLRLGDAAAEEWAGARRKTGVRMLHQQVERLFEEARDDVFRYLLTLGLYPPQAQETTQEVFLRLYTALRDGDAIDNPRAWVFRVAHNLGLNVRAKEDNLRPFDPEIEVQLADPSPNTEQRLVDRERMLRVHRAVENLSDQQRQCLHLRAEGLRYHEIAEALGVGTSTVGEFLRRAIVRIRKAVHE